MSEENVILGNTPAAIDGAIVAVSQKASTAYVKQVAVNLDAKKVDKSAYDAKIAEIEETLSNSASGLADRVEALEAYDATVPGLISTAVDAEAVIARAAEKANADAIAVINGSAEGSIAKAVADEAALRVAADEALDGRLDTVEGQITTINSTGEGSIAKALADAKAYTDGKETTLQAAIDGKVDKNDTDRLMTVAEGEKLAALPTNDALTSALGAKANAADVYAKSETYSATEVDGKIAPLAVKADVEASLALKANAADVYTKSQVDAKVASVFRYMGPADSVAALDQITAPAVGDVYQVGSEEYVRTSGGTWEHLGTAVDLSPYSTTTQMNSAISAAVLVEENRAKGVESGLDTRLTTAEDDIDALEGRMGTAEAAIGTVDSRIATAKGEAIADAGTAADSKISTAIGALTINGQSFSNNAAVVTGSQVALGDGFTPAANGYLTGLDANNSVTAAIDVIDQTLTTITGGSTGEGGSIAALQTQINTNASDIDALETRAGTIETAATALTNRVDTAEGAITKLNGDANTTGSVAKAVADEAALRVDGDNALDARLDVIEGTGTGSIAKAVADEATRATDVEGQLRTDVDAAAAKAAANETAIGVLNGGDTVVGSVAKQVKDAVDAEATTARAAESALSARVDELEDGHVASSIPTTLEAGKRYVVTTTCNATLPAEAADGSIVEVYVLVGGAGRTIAAAGSDTILGQSLPCAIGISEEGWQLDNESYIFVKNGTNWHVL